MGGLKAHYGADLDIKVVKTGDTLNIGKRNLSFVLTPMVHWPDNMVTWCPEDKILFSNDAFGKHIAKVMAKYDKWASNNADEKAVIVYDTMWGSTQKLAYAIADGFENSNIPFQMFNLQYNHISDIMTELVEAKYICVGSPTLNNNILPTNASFLTYLKGLAPKNRIALAFGSYGWGGQSIGLVREDLEKCKFEMWEDVKHQYIPSQEYLDQVTKTIMNNLKKEKE